MALHPKRVRANAMDVPCAPCTLMFSRRGLEYLHSPDGFRHRTRAECLASGSGGCRICKLIYSMVCRSHENWEADDRLIFRNIQGAHSTSLVSGIPLPGIDALRGSLESEPGRGIGTIYPFAKGGQSFPLLVEL